MSTSRWYWRVLLVPGGVNLLLGGALLIFTAWDQPTKLGLALGLFVAVQAGLAIWLWRRIARPLEELARTAEGVAAGEVQQRLQPETARALGPLGEAFGRMCDELAGQVHQLRDSSQRLGTVLGSMVEGVIVVDPDERILLANEGARRLLNIAATDVSGRRLREVARSHHLHETVAAAFASQGARQAEFDVPGGERRVLALRTARLPGEPSPGVVAVLHDVTELRRLENLRREFVANVSHELKTPLAAIKAYAETLRMGAINDAAHNVEFVLRIEEQSDRLHQLILDLISLARVESGEETFEIVEVDLAGVVEACLKDQGSAAQGKTVRLHVAPPAAEVVIKADEQGVRTILDNLVDNAIKYTPPGGAVHVRWWSEQTEAVLEVQDTGIGIAPRDQERIFERFYRADKARSQAIAGTGLGLAIVKHLVQALGGSVGLISKLGEGSTFRVRLPLA